MDIAEFRNLSELDQLELIMQSGHLQVQSHEENCRIFLYKLQDFYVSTRYLISSDQLIGIDCFHETESLFPFQRNKKQHSEPAGRCQENSGR